MENQHAQPTQITHLENIESISPHYGQTTKIHTEHRDSMLSVQKGVGNGNSPTYVLPAQQAPLVEFSLAVSN